MLALVFQEPMVRKGHPGDKFWGNYPLDFGIEIYPVDHSIHILNNWCQMNKNFLVGSTCILSCYEILAVYFPLLNGAEMGGSVRGEKNVTVSHLLSLDHSQEGYNDGVLEIKAQVLD